jgi:uncharacterized membrane protein
MGQIRADTKEDTHIRSRTRAWTVALVAILAATGLGGNYVLSGTPNIELSSVMVFLSGFLFGIPVGALVGLVTMTIYQIWNPWGGFIPPIGLAVIFCTTFTGIVGGIAGRNIYDSQNIDSKRLTISAALLGVFTTLFFDLVTNFAFSITINQSYTLILCLGLPLMLVHVISNGLLFGLLVPSVTPIIKNTILY